MKMASKKKTKNYEIDMCHGPILKKLLVFSIPLMCSSILQLLFNAADIVVVGRFAGDNALAAVGSNTSLISLLTNLFIGLSIGSNILAAMYYGAKREKDLSETVHTSIVLSVISGLALTFVGVLGAHQILLWMKTPSEVIELAALYLKIYFCGMTATMVYNFGSAILRAKGDTKRPLHFLMTAGIINVVLNLILVIKFQMGVAGVGLATVISQFVSAGLIIRCLMMEEGGTRLELKKMHIQKNKLIQILKIGIPAGFQGVLFAFANVAIQSSVNSFGAVVVAGNSAASNIEGFVYAAMNAFYQAAISFVSQNAGAGNYKRITKIVLRAQASVIVVGLVFGNLAVFFGRDLLRIYSDSEPVINAGMQRLGIVSRTYALCGIMDVMAGAIRGIGYSIMPMIVSLLGACVFRLIWIATIFQIDGYHTVTTVYESYPISWMITFSVHILCFIWAMKQKQKKETESLALSY